MDTHKLIVKFFATTDALPEHAIVPVFQQWIREHRIADHLLIDVADYAHVVNGPGTLLISSEANISLDHGHGRLGLMYARKRPLPGDFKQRIYTALTTAAQIAAMLEQEPALQGKLKFLPGEAELRINDRLAAPNTDASFAAAEPDITAAAREAWNAEVTITRVADPLGLLTASIRTTATTLPRITQLAGAA